MLRKTGTRPKERYTIFLEDFGREKTEHKWAGRTETWLRLYDVIPVSFGNNIIGVDSIKLFNNVSYRKFNQNYRPY
jgi:hypothetical protein